MKKIISICLILTISCCLIFSLSSCRDDDHTHSYGAWSIKAEADCNRDGVRKKKCSCGDVVTETIPALGHNYIGGICTDCGKSE